MKTACACGCGRDHKPDWLIEVETWLESIFGDGLYCTSGNRCECQNKLAGGSSKSRHLDGDAFDIAHVSVQPEYIYMALIMKYADKGIGFYPLNGFVHIDGREVGKRWVRMGKGQYLPLADYDFIRKYITKVV